MGAATSPDETRLFPKSLRRSPDGWYGTVVTEETLASALWWSHDGLTWTERHAWPDGDVDPSVLLVDGDVLYLSLVPRPAPEECGSCADGDDTAAALLLPLLLTRRRGRPRRPPLDAPQRTDP